MIRFGKHRPLILFLVACGVCLSGADGNRRFCRFLCQHL